jgi:hypothetical protein
MTAATVAGPQIDLLPPKVHEPADTSPVRREIGELAPRTAIVSAF